MSIRRRTAAYGNIQRRSIIGPEITIRDVLLILRAAIRVTLITTLNNILPPVKEIKRITQTLKSIHTTLITLGVMPENLIIVLPILLPLEHLLQRKQPLQAQNQLIRLIYTCLRLQNPPRSLLRNLTQRLTHLPIVRLQPQHYNTP